MSFVNDKLYNGYLRRNMPTIVSKVKVREIVIHLPCLTAHDRETIEAKRETSGNFEAMILLLDCLKRRENWPEQFIDALEACEHHTIAADIRREYNALRGSNSNPSSPPMNVVRAHVHPPPSDSHLPIPESGAAAASPAEAPPAPPEPATQAPPPPETPSQLLQATQTPAAAAAAAAAQVPEAVSPPEPAAEPPQSTHIDSKPPPSTPPPSPETPHAQMTTPPLQQREINSHQEPEENSESDIPVQGRSANVEVLVNSATTPHPVEQTETGAPSYPDHLQTAPATEEEPPRSQSPAQMDSDESSFLTLTPAKAPVQDTTPPVNTIPAAVLQPEETSEPAAAQIVESSPQTETAATTSPQPDAAAAALVNTSLNDDDSVCLSKPGQLVSIQPANHTSPTVPASMVLVEPYSGNSDRLEISEAAPDVVSSSACSAVENTDTALPCQENGIAPNHNEPEENHYESPSQSLDMQEVQENVVHVSGVPSILNQGGQTPAPQIQINGEAAKEFTSAPPADTVSGSCEPAAADISLVQNSDDKTALQTNLSRSPNTKYVLTAVGVGACALLAAWRFKS